MRQVRGREYNVVVATSGRLMTAVLGSWISRAKRAPLYLDIRDIFVDTIADLSLRRVAWAAKPFFSGVERWAFERASLINLASRGFTPYFSRRYPHHRFTYHPNGIDSEFLDAPPTPLPGANGSGRPPQMR